MMDWTPEAIETLRRMWAEGAFCGEIGTALGCSKNAVIGKAHRLNLPSRPTPIKKQKPPPPGRPMAVLRAPIPAPIVIAPPQDLVPMRQQVAAKMRDRPNRFAPLLPGSYARRCQMPLWDDGPPQFRRDGTPRMCYKPSRDERTSYCAECAARVFRRVAA